MVARRNLVLKDDMSRLHHRIEYKSLRQTLKCDKKREHLDRRRLFLDYVKESLIAEHGFSEEELRLGGFRIYTTLISPPKSRRRNHKLPGFTGKDRLRSPCLRSTREPVKSWRWWQKLYWNGEQKQMYVNRSAIKLCVRWTGFTAALLKQATRHYL